MPNRRSNRSPDGSSALKSLFAVPSAAFYGTPSICCSGGEIEISNFRRLADFDGGSLRVLLDGGSVQISGDSLTILALEKKRILLKGRFRKVEFFYENEP